MLKFHPKRLLTITIKDGCLRRVALVYTPDPFTPQTWSIVLLLECSSYSFLQSFTFSQVPGLFCKTVLLRYFDSVILSETEVVSQVKQINICIKKFINKASSLEQEGRQKEKEQ